MTIEELAARLPEELRVRPELVPAEVAEGIEYLTARDAMINAGTLVADVPSIEEWRTSRGH